MTNPTKPSSVSKTSQTAAGFRALATKVLEDIVPIPLLQKIAKIREIGADTELIDLLLKKANHSLTLEEIIAEFGSYQFRQVYVNLDPELQHQIEIIISPPTLLGAPGRRARKESEIWQQRELIHRLKTEPVETKEGTKRRTWEEVTKELHAQGVLKEKSKDQIYWTLKDKHNNANLSPEDKKLVDEMFVRVQRGSLKTQVEQMADIISMARQRHTWDETQKILAEFADWKGTLQQLMGAYARVRSKHQKKSNRIDKGPTKTADK